MKKILFALLLLVPAAPVAAQTCNNLVTNGDFEAGGTTPSSFGFTTDYIYATPGTNSLVPEGRYTLVNDPSSVHFNFAASGDHTSGSGRMMVINGATLPNTIVWEQTISVTPNTVYYFSTWVQNVVSGNDAILQFSINGSQIGSNFTATGLSQWQRFFTTWNSGSNTSAVIRLIDQQTAFGGNDFAIDDVYFTATAPLVISSAAPSPASCAGAADGSIAVTAAGGVGPFSYSLNGGAFVAATGNPFTIGGLNPGSYSLVIRDFCGSLSPAVTGIVVGASDQTAPVVSGCPANITVFTGPGRATCDQVATWTPPTAADNCSAVNTSSSHQSGDVFPKGTTTVTYTFTDASNNSATCRFTVTVIDNTPPVVTASSISVNNDAGSCGAVVNYPTPAMTDNCPICDLTAIPGYTFLGTYQGHRYYKSTASGNWNDFQAYAQSIGGHLATINSSGEESFILSSGGTGQAWIGFTDAATEGTFLWVTGEPVGYTNWCGVPIQEPNNLGNEDVTTINWCTDGSWNDLDADLNSRPAIIEFDCEPVRTGGPASGSVFPVGTTVVTYTGMDGSGNTSTVSFNVTVADNERPVITTNGNQSVNNDPGICGATVAVSATATDNCGVSGTPAGVRSDAQPLTAVFPVGTTTIAWNVTDIHGNAAASVTQTVVVADNERPVARCKAHTVTLSGGAASISPADVDDNSSDNCGIASRSVSPNTFDCDDIGNHTVTLTVTDIYGLVSTCTSTVTVAGARPTCSITVTPANNTFTGGVPTNIYLGYGPQSATINVHPTGGSGFSYAWSGPVSALSCTNCANPVFTPTAPGTYTYTVLVTNSNGCTTTCSVTFCVKDIRVPGNGNNNKVYICHVPPGNPANAHTLSVSPNAVPAHLGNHGGDRLGACDQTCGNPVARMIQGDRNELGESVQVYPNPNNGAFTVELPYIEDKALITVTDVAGKIIQNRIVRDGDGYKQSFNLGDAARGIYFVEVICGEQRSRTKLVIR